MHASKSYETQLMIEISIHVINFIVCAHVMTNK